MDQARICKWQCAFKELLTSGSTMRQCVNASNHLLTYVGKKKPGKREHLLYTTPIPMANLAHKLEIGM